MWRSAASRSKSRAVDPARLTLRELMATQPRHVRGKLAPGERFPTGMRPGRRRAQGSDLDSIGPYVPGDDIRWMDWRATARTGRAQMKRFVAESHLGRMLIVDFRAHLLFGSGDRPMAKTAALLAAHLAWEAFALQEPVGLVIIPFGTLVRPRRGRGHVLHILKHLEDGYTAAVADRQEGTPDVLADAIDAASGLLGAGDEICVFSDFGDAPESLSRRVRELQSIRRFRAIVVEDGMYHREISAGRFPYHTGDNAERRLATVSGADTGRHGETVSDLRRDLRRSLIKDGWLITEATGGGVLSPGGAR